MTFDLHLKNWPQGVPHDLNMPERSIFANLVESASIFPDRVALVYHGRSFSYSGLLDHVQRLAGYLSHIGVAPGDRVLLYMQNSPQFVIGYYAIMAANAVCVPVNPMNKQAELEYLVQDTGAAVCLCGAELWPQLGPLIDSGALQHGIVASYADMADPDYDLPLPALLANLTEPADATGWSAMMAENHPAPPHTAGPDDLALIPYSSGTTGQPKGCMHTHRSVMATAWGGMLWNPTDGPAVVLATLPLFHVTGMQNSMNTPILAGHTTILMTRWDRKMAAELIRRYNVTRWRSITTMAIDLVNDPDFNSYDLSSLEAIGGGGAAMPEAIALKLKDMTGLDYVEGYGMSETMAATHINPLHAPRPQCLGIPVMEVDARVMSVEDGRELGPNEDGEIIMHGPQVFQGYWNRPDETAKAFVELDGKRFIRSGDIGRYDQDGYFYMTDRVKRMINASGFKVWPAEVEALMLHCPLVAEACVIATPDSRRGEAVKAVVVPAGPQATHDQIIDWCKANMAAYKCPTVIEFVESLPKSGTGKVQWRLLAEQERSRA